MFNREEKEDAERRLKRAHQKYEEMRDGIIEEAQSLHKDKLELKKVIIDFNKYIRKLSNTSNEIKADMQDINTNLKSFSEEIQTIEEMNSQVAAGSAVGAGVAAGVGVATLGPTAAMAVATTFGTASTGTAISALSGAAATNAALAWLGGGALAAGGGGMAAGEALLLLAGPVGWGIAAAGMLTGGFLYSNKNKKVAEKMRHAARDIERGVEELGGLRENMLKFMERIRELSEDIEDALSAVDDLPLDYKAFSPTQKQQLGTLINLMLTGSQMINEKAGS